MIGNRYKAVTIALIFVIMFSCTTVFCSMNLPVTSAQPSFVDVSVSGNTKLGVNETGLYTATVAQDYGYSYVYNWSILPSDANVVLAPNVDSCSLTFVQPTEEPYLLICNVVSTGDEVRGAGMLTVYDPYTSAGLYLNGYGASYSMMVQADRVGWYRCVNGTDGSIVSSSTNAATVIQSAFNSVSVGGKVYIQSGDYDTSTASLIMPTNVTVTGDGHATHIYSTNTTLLTTNAAAQNFYMRLTNIRFDGCGLNGTLIDWQNTKQSWIEGCEFFSTGGDMIKLTSTGGYESFYNYVTGNYFENPSGVYQKQDYSIAAVWSQGDNIISHNVFDNYPSQYNMFIAINTVNAGDIITDNHITHIWIGVRTSTASTICNNYFDTFRQSGVSISGKSDVSIANNFFLANPSVAYYYAIDAGSTCSFIRISGNSFYAMSSEDFFINFGSSVSNSTIIGNSFDPTNLYKAYNDLGSNNTKSLNVGAPGA